MKVYITIACCIFLSFTQSCKYNTHTHTHLSISISLFNAGKVQVSLNNGPIFNASQEVVVQEGDHISVDCDYCSYNNYVKYLFKTNLSDYSQVDMIIVNSENYTTIIDTSLSFQCCQNDGIWNCPRTTIINVTKNFPSKRAVQ